MKRLTQSLLTLAVPLLTLTACSKESADKRPAVAAAPAASPSAAPAAAPTRTTGTGIDTKIVGADAQWVMNINLNSLRESVMRAHAREAINKPMTVGMVQMLIRQPEPMFI